MEEQEYVEKLARAGFTEIGVEPWRVYQTAEARSFIEDAGLDYEAVAPHAEGKFMSAFVRARKPTAA
jgi:hypothetical protein